MAQPTNPHFVPAPSYPAGTTLIEWSGLETASFTQTHALAVTTLLLKHDLAGHMVVRDDDLWYIMPRQELPSDPIRRLEIIEQEYWFLLNYDDESNSSTLDATIPPAFFADLLPLLYQIQTGKQLTPTTDTPEFLHFISRQGLIVSDESDPRWSDYLQLLNL